MFNDQLYPLDNHSQQRQYALYCQIQNETSSMDLPSKADGYTRRCRNSFEMSFEMS